MENALLHGILSRPDKQGEIRITGEECGGEVRVTVRDNGCGMTAAQVAALFDESREGGVGLRNTDARLRMQCGPSCGLQVQSEEGEYTAVTVHVPKMDAESPFFTKSFPEKDAANGPEKEESRNKNPDCRR